MSHNFLQPNRRHAESFGEEHHGSYMHYRPAHHNLNFADFREEDYCVSKVNSPAHYEATDCCTKTVYGNPGYGKYYGDKVVSYETVREEDVVVDNCVERKHHGRFNRFGGF